MNILLTGATGFIGQHLLKQLSTATERLYCIARDPSTLPKTCSTFQNVIPIKGDLLDKTIYSRFPEKIDVIVHLAASLGKWDIDESDILANNVLTTEHLLSWFRTIRGKQFIFVSTPGVQGLGCKLAPETAPYRPRGLYEISKVMAERRVIHFRYLPGQFWTILRPDFVYGPGDYRRIRLYKRIKKRLWINIGDGGSVIRPTYVNDACNAITACINNNNSRFEVFNIGGPEIVTWKKYFSTIAKLLGIQLLPLRIPTLSIKTIAHFVEKFAKITKSSPLVTKTQIDFLTQDHATDIFKISKSIGFTPQTNLTIGMKKTLFWAIKENLI